MSTLGHWYSGWMVLDTAWYVYLAEHGYDAKQEQAFDEGRQSAIAYFPAYPLTVRQVARLTGHDYGAAAMLTTFACGLAFVLLFWYWCRDRLSRTARRTAVVLLLVYPVRVVPLRQRLQRRVLPRRHRSVPSSCSSTITLCSPASRLRRARGETDRDGGAHRTRRRRARATRRAHP